MTDSQPIEQLGPKPEKKKVTPGQIGGGILTALALTSVLGSGCAAKSTGVRTTTTNEAASNGNNASPESTNSESVDKFSETDKYDERMEDYKNMEIGQFESLAFDERQLYAQYLIDQTINRGTYDQVYGSQSEDSELYIKPVNVSTDNNGQEIVDVYNRGLQISLLQFVEGEDQPYDLADGRKLLSSVFYEVGDVEVSKSYLLVRAYQEKRTKSSNINNKLTATDTSDLLTGADSDGEKVQYKIVTYYNQVAETVYARFIYKEFTSYDGSRKSSWFLDVEANSVEELNEIAI